MKKPPSKFSKGVGLLWRGMSLKITFQFLLDTVIYRKLERTKDNNNELIFETSRSALINCLMYQKTRKIDGVVISSFNCNVITCAVMRTSATYELLLIEC